MHDSSRRMPGKTNVHMGKNRVSPSIQLKTDIWICKNAQIFFFLLFCNWCLKRIFMWFPEMNFDEIVYAVILVGSIFLGKAISLTKLPWAKTGAIHLGRGSARGLHLSVECSPLVHRRLCQLLHRHIPSKAVRCSCQINWSVYEFCVTYSLTYCWIGSPFTAYLPYDPYSGLAT